MKSPEQLILFAGASHSHAPMFRWRDAVRDWLASGAGFGGSLNELLGRCGLSGFSSKTSLACYPATADGTLPQSFVGWSNSGIAVRGGYLTLSLSEGVQCTAMSSETDQCHNDAGGSSLSRILETGPIPPKYFLSPKAAAGILRRAAKRGRTLPAVLMHALTELAKGTTQPTLLERSTAAETTVDSEQSRESI